MILLIAMRVARWPLWPHHDLNRIILALAPERDEAKDARLKHRLL